MLGFSHVVGTLDLGCNLKGKSNVLIFPIFIVSDTAALGGMGGQRIMGNDREVELALDVSAEDARALHRVVRAMHDGHCPSCGYLGDARQFINTFSERDHVCPNCGFTIYEKEADAALKAFRSHLLKSVEVFHRWREGELRPRMGT